MENNTTQQQTPHEYVHVSFRYFFFKENSKLESVKVTSQPPLMDSGKLLTLTVPAQGAKRSSSEKEKGPEPDYGL